MSPARWTRTVAGRPYPQRAPSVVTIPEPPVPAFLRTVAVPWSGALAVLVVGTVEYLLDGRGSSLPVTLAVLGLIAVAGLLAPWFPIGAALVVGLTFPVGSGFGLDGPNGAQLFALLLSTGWAGSQAPMRRSWWAPAADQVLATVGILLWGAAPSQAWENLFFSLLLWASWAVGLLTRRSRERAERLGRLAARMDAEREIAEAAAVAAERARIARDVHDSVAHSVSVMVLQVGALRTTLEPGSRIAEVLQGVERLGRQSVDELRGLVGVLRETPEGPPTAAPSLARVSELLDEVRAAGLPVELEVHGEPRELPQAMDVSAYRVLQEALSNVLRHAGRVPTAVSLRHDAAALVVQVEDSGPVAPRASDGVGGHGLLGIRERVALFRGVVEAGPLPGGGFRLSARFPLQDAR
jgi:signal transduction histidine kinase